MVDNIKTGIDLVEIKRMEISIQKDADFLMRFFGEEERKLFNVKNSIERIAGNFAVKEAFAKALGTGVRGFSLCEVQALRNDDGAPYLFLTGKAKELAQKERLDFSVSLSHTKNFATAIVIAYQNNNKE